MRAEVTLHIAAPPDKVWELVSDITKMGEYSPEVIEAEWVGAATKAEVGARYRGHVKRNESWPILYWTTCEITECVPGKVFEFAVVMRERPLNKWRYEFRQNENGGTDVTESFDLGDNLFTKVWRPLGGFFTGTSQQAGHAAHPRTGESRRRALLGPEVNPSAPPQTAIRSRSCPTILCF